jgi:hypothetical protein
VEMKRNHIVQLESRQKHTRAERDKLENQVINKLNQELEIELAEPENIKVFLLFAFFKDFCLLFD